MNFSDDEDFKKVKKVKLKSPKVVISITNYPCMAHIFNIIWCYSTAEPYRELNWKLGHTLGLWSVMSKVMDVKEKDGKFYAYYLNFKKKKEKKIVIS